MEDVTGDASAEADAQATAFVASLPDGGLRVVSTASEGSQVLSLQAAAPTFEAVPTFGDSSDDVEASSADSDDGALEGDGGEEGDGTGVSVPAPAFAVLAMALLAAAAFARRKR